MAVIPEKKEEKREIPVISPSILPAFRPQCRERKKDKMPNRRLGTANDKSVKPKTQQ